MGYNLFFRTLIITKSSLKGKAPGQHLMLSSSVCDGPHIPSEFYNEILNFKSTHVDCTGRKVPILKMLLKCRFLHGGLKLSRWGVLSIQSAFLCPQIVIVCCSGTTPSLESLSKNQIDDEHKTQCLIRDWLCSTGHLHKASLTTHSVFSCLWLCQSWMFGFRFSMLDVSLQAELLFAVPLPPSNTLFSSKLTWQTSKTRKATESPFLRPVSEQYWGKCVNKHCYTEGIKPLGKCQEGSAWRSQEPQSGFPSLQTVL